MAVLAAFTLLACQDGTEDPPPDYSLTLEAVSPRVGPAGGGIPMILRGKNFTAGAQVRVGGVVAPNVTWRSSSELHLTLPATAGTVGPVSVEISTPDGQSVDREDLFCVGSILERPVGGQPLSLVSADFDGDGHPDLASWGRVDDSVSILFGLGQGRFGRPLRLPIGGVGPEAAGLVVADFDGDGRPDLVFSAQATLLRNLGGGRFATAVPLLPGVSPSQVSVGDFNGDGRPDLVLMTWDSLSGSVLLNQGAGRFAPVSYVSLGANANSRTAGIGDFNGDGKADLATAVAGGVAVLTSVAGARGAPRMIPLSGHPVSVSASDLTGDGIIDLAVTNNGLKAIQILAGDGTGSFTLIASLPVGKNPGWATLGDLNGDGIADLVVANLWGASLSVILSKGAGGFGPTAQIPVGGFPEIALMADLDEDGRLDLASANSSGGSLSLVLSGDHGDVGPMLDLPIGGGSHALVTSDFDGDGNADLAVISDTNVVNVLLSDGMGWYTRTDFPSGTVQLFDLQVGDMNGDGRPDLVATSAGMLNVLPNTGAGHFGAWITTPTAGNVLYALAVSDFNGDGKLDVTVFPNDGDGLDVLLSLGTGLGSFLPPTPVPVGSPIYSVTTGDFNGDRARDLAVTYQNGQVIGVLLGTGTGSFGAPQPVPLGGSGPIAITVADLNGDGRDDLAVSVQAGPDTKGLGIVSVLLGHGDGTFAVPATYVTGSGTQSVAVGDFNGDRIPDLGVANSLGNSVSILLGKGAGSFELLDNVQVNDRPSNLVVLDVNGDGKTDIALPSWTTDSISILLNRF